MFSHLTLAIVPAVFAVYIPMCAPHVRATAPRGETPMAQLWEKPLDLGARDLYHGPWGSERAPDPRATYTFVARKQHGTNPGVIVIDARGREWHVKQPPRNHQGAEGPVEVVLSRVLSAVGYHQPPVYFVPSFAMTDASGTHQEPGGRFRLKVSALTKRGDWSWQQNPFVGTRPYQGLLVILAMFDSSDLKNVNNTLYEMQTTDDGAEPVVRRSRSRHGAGRNRPAGPEARRSGHLRTLSLHHRRQRRVRRVQLPRVAPGAAPAPDHSGGRPLGERSPGRTQLEAVVRCVPRRRIRTGSRRSVHSTASRQSG